MRYVAYYRVSPEAEGFGSSDIHLEEQVQRVHAYLERRQGELLCEFTEIGSDLNGELVELTRAVRRARACRATLLVANISRLGRDLCATSKLLSDKDLTIEVCDLPDTDWLTRMIMAIVAHHEVEWAKKNRSFNQLGAYVEVLGSTAA